MEGQLLGVTIEHEQPELEQQKSDLLRKEEEFKVQLAGLEKKLLEALATSEGDILENTVLIESLTKTKSTSANIEQALEKSATKSAELDEEREKYASFASDGSKLYFLVKQLHTINHMFRFSLSSFIGLFKATLTSAVPSSGGLKEKLARLTPILESKILFYVGRSLFKEDRLMFAIHLVYGMYKSKLFEQNEWKLFLGEIVSAGKDDEDDEASSKAPRGFPTWASNERFEAFTQLKEACPSLVQQACFDSQDIWGRWSKSLECEIDFPSKVNGQFSAFQKLLLVQAFRPDRLYSAMQQFVCEVLNLKSFAPPPLDFGALYANESAVHVPILMITSPGADPSQELYELACRTSGIGKDKYTEVAMGGGQQEVALHALRHAAENGEWLCLQNLHLVVSWLPILEKELNTILGGESSGAGDQGTNGPHASFRLWLTSEAHDNFPLILLQQCLKITIESPPGIKKNMQRTYAQWGDTFGVESNKGDATSREQLLFMLAWYHALSQERRSYVPQGWSKFYEFSSGDLRAGANVILLIAEKSESSDIDWESLHGLMENAIYGGRVDNPYDIRVLQAYLRKYFNSSIISGKSAITKLGKGNLFLPKSSSRAAYGQLVDQLTDTDSPSVFGLPENIERSLQRVKSSGVSKQLRLMTSCTTSGSKFDREKWRQQLGPIIELWEKLVPRTKQRNGGESTTESIENSSPIEGFVFMESLFSLNLVKSVYDMIDGIKKVIYGTGMLTPNIQTTGLALLSGTVPDTWNDQWEGSDNIFQWLKAVAKRRSAISKWQSWCIDGGSKTLLSRPLRLADLFHPGTFLNALRQQTARQLSCSMDELQLVTAWDESKLPNPDIFVELTDVLLQGAGFDGGCLSEAGSHAQELVSVPSIYIAYVSSSTKSKSSNGSMEAPLYLTCTRERVLAEITTPLLSNDSPDKWIMSGVAFFLSEE